MLSDQASADCFRWEDIMKMADSNIFFRSTNVTKQTEVKIKVKKWIDTPDLPRYTEYINAWHNFQKQVQAAFARIRMQDGEEESKNAQIKQMCMYILNIMYVARYEENRDFYEQFEMRLEHLKELLESGI